MTTDRKVRPGRECRDCGEDRVAEMVRHRGMLGGHDTRCRACHRKRARRYRAANPEAERECQRRYRAANREAERDYNRQYRATLAARTDEQLADAACESHPLGTKQCRGGHLAPVAAFGVDRTRRDGLRMYCRECWAAKAAERYRRAAEAYWAEHGIPDRCTYCLGPAEHRDHVVPLRLGGADALWNLRPACAACNLSKNASPLPEWLATRAVVPYSDVLAAVLSELATHGTLGPSSPTTIHLEDAV